MTESSKVETAAKVDLSADELWSTFEIGGQSIEIELWEADELLTKWEAEELRRLKQRCRKCGESFVWPESDWGKEMRCPCGSDDVEQNQEQWDAIAAKLVERYKFPRCGRVAARVFYHTVLDATRTAKKKNEPEPESPTGSTSTQEAGETVVPTVG